MGGTRSSERTGRVALVSLDDMQRDGQRVTHSERLAAKREGSQLVACLAGYTLYLLPAVCSDMGVGVRELGGQRRVCWAAGRQLRHAARLAGMLLLLLLLLPAALTRCGQCVTVTELCLLFAVCCVLSAVCCWCALSLSPLSSLVSRCLPLSQLCLSPL